jgi:protein-tyrosine phosphatase
MQQTNERLPGGISEILPNLFLGNIGAAKNKKLLLQHNIKYIVRVLNIKDHIYEGEYMYHIVEIEDHDEVNLIQHFDNAVAFIQEKMNLNDGNVFIHCAQGKSRSPSVVIAYLMKQRDMTLKEALSHVQKCRPVVYPNSGFMEQLAQYENIVKQPK